MAKTNFIKVNSETSPLVFWTGAKVYLKEGFSSGLKYISADLGNNYFLIGDCKKDCDAGRGYIYHRCDIAKVQALW